MMLTKEETITTRSALDLLDETQAIFCATHCDACPFNNINTDDCMFEGLMRRIGQVLENYGREDAE